MEVTCCACPLFHTLQAGHWMGLPVSFPHHPSSNELLMLHIATLHIL